MALTEEEELELLELELELEEESQSSLSSNKGGKSFTELPFSQQKGLAIESAKALGREVFQKPAIALGKGMVEGATMGAKKFDRPLEGSSLESVYNPEDSNFRGVGRFIGGTVPLAAAASISGGMLGAAGLPAIGMKSAALTGAVYGGMQGAVDQKGAGESINKIAENTAAFSLLQGAGNAFKYIGNKLKNTVGPALSNTFFNTERRIAERLYRKGEPDLGTQAINYKDRYGENPLAGIKNRDEVYKNVVSELKTLQNESGAILKQLDEQSNKPKLGVNKQLAIEYNPRQKPVIRVPSDYQPQAQEYINQSPLGTTKNLGEGIVLGGVKTPKTQDIPSIRNTGLFVTDEGVSTTGQSISRKTPSQIKEMKKNEFKLNKKKAEELENVTDLKDTSKRDLNLDYKYTLDKSGPFLNINDVANDLDRLITEYERVGKKTGPSKVMKKIKQDFIESNPENVSYGDAITVKTTLDKIVDDAYDKLQSDTTIRDQVYETFANGIRRRAYQISPALGENFDKQALLHDLKVGLIKANAKAPSREFIGFWSTLYRSALGTPPSLGAATAIEKGAKVFNPRVNRLIGRGSQNLIGLGVNQEQ